jgi:hypothetical protein
MFYSPPLRFGSVKMTGLTAANDEKIRQWEKGTEYPEFKAMTANIDFSSADGFKRSLAAMTPEQAGPFAMWKRRIYCRSEDPQTVTWNFLVLGQDSATREMAERLATMVYNGAFSVAKTTLKAEYVPDKEKA